MIFLIVHLTQQSYADDSTLPFSPYVKSASSFATKITTRLSLSDYIPDVGLDNISQ